VLIRRVKQEFRVNNLEIFALLVDAAFAHQEDLLALGQGFYGHGPLFQGNLAIIWQNTLLTLKRIRKTIAV